MKKIWIKKFKSFKEADEADNQYYFKMSPAERIETMQYLREIYLKFKGKRKNDGRKRLRRVIKVFQQA